LKGKPVFLDHVNAVSHIVGGVLDAWVEGNKVKGVLQIVDEKLQKLLELDPPPVRDLSIDAYVQLNEATSDSEEEKYEHVEAGMTFKQRKAGEQDSITQIVTSEEVYLPNLTWAGAIRFPRSWFEDNKVRKITQALQDAKVYGMDTKANFLYTLIKEVDYPSVSFDTSSHDAIVESLNKAYVKLRRTLGRDVINQSRLKLVCSPEIATLINEIKQNALAVTKKFAFNFDVIDTVHFAENDNPKLVVARVDQYLQQRTPLIVDQEFDSSTLEIKLKLDFLSILLFPSLIQNFLEFYGFRIVH
jgi:CRISPR/Cas system CSM-associated protein Csm2 small subunit